MIIMEFENQGIEKKNLNGKEILQEKKLGITSLYFFIPSSGTNKHLLNK